MSSEDSCKVHNDLQYFITRPTSPIIQKLIVERFEPAQGIADYNALAELSDATGVLEHVLSRFA